MIFLKLSIIFFLIGLFFINLFVYIYIYFFQAYELSTLTGTQVMLLVASETGHVYTFATRKLQPMITSESGKALIQTCLNSPDPPVSQTPNLDQRMSETGYEETDLTYTVNENDAVKMQVRKNNLHQMFSRFFKCSRLKFFRLIVYCGQNVR